MHEISIEIAENVGVFDRYEVMVHATDKFGMDSVETIECETKQEVRTCLLDLIGKRVDDLL